MVEDELISGLDRCVFLSTGIGIGVRTVIVDCEEVDGAPVVRYFDV
jgi:hypothetical protein